MWHLLAVLVGAGVLLASGGCAGRYIRIEEKGLTCAEAQQIAITAVRRMNYTIETATNPLPGAPGMIIGSITEGTTKRGLLVQVFCTSIGASIEAKTDQGGLADLNFPAEFRRSFEVAAAARPPLRKAAESGVDVLLTPERSGSSDLGVDVSAVDVVPVRVRISNHSARVYGFRVEDVVLHGQDGTRVKAIPVHSLAKLSPADQETLREKVVADADIAAGETLTGYLLFPFKAYARARVMLIDRDAGEPEGFSIDF